MPRGHILVRSGKRKRIPAHKYTENKMMLLNPGKILLPVEGCSICVSYKSSLFAKVRGESDLLTPSGDFPLVGIKRIESDLKRE